MKRYERYKPSGIEWIGEIPGHWEVRKLKYVGQVQLSGVDKKNEPDERKVLLCNYIDVYKNEFIDDNLSFMEASAAENEIERFTLNRGDVLITKDSETPDDIANPAFVRVEKAEIICGYHLAHIRTNRDIMIGEYLFRLFQSPDFNATFTANAHGITRYGLSVDDIKSTTVLLPTVNEQTDISNYLDRKTAQIDNLIAKKQKLIDLLNEEKTGIINQAMTKGLNPNAPMKDSGIPGLGEIPAHWQVKRLKYVVETRLEYGANEPSDSDNPDDPRYIRITDFDETGNLRDDTFRSLPMEKAKDYLLRENDILFARSGATVGKTFIFKHFRSLACFAGYLIRARPNSNLIMPEFLYFFTKCGAYEDWKKSIFNQATIQNIGADKYNVLDIPLPAKPEQEIIVRHIETNLQRISKIISRIQREIELLQEYRTALISEAVTGKIDVRGFASREENA